MKYNNNYNKMNNSEKEISQFSVGDEIAVHLKIVEPEKVKKGKKEQKTRERIQIFDGVVIARKGSGASEMFTVRKVSYGEGVERIFPFHSPLIKKTCYFCYCNSTTSKYQ